MATPLDDGQAGMAAGASSPGGVGSGAGPGVGPGSGSGSGHGSAAVMGTGVDLGIIRERIARVLVYPPTARNRGWAGRVVVAFVLLRDGDVRDVRVVTSSGFRLLDRGAVEAVMAARPFPAPADEVEITTPVLFRLD